MMRAAMEAEVDVERRSLPSRPVALRWKPGLKLLGVECLVEEIPRLVHSFADAP
jgi:hypothetical protein